MNLQQHQNLANRLQQKRQQAKQTCRAEQTAVNNSEQHLESCKEAQKILQGVAQAVQNKVHQRIASVVTRCLETVFGDAYKFQINFVQKRGKTEAELVFVNQQGVEMHPTSSTGGGVVDVAAFALRLACLLLSKPKLRRVLVLDEPFKFASEEFRPVIRQLLETLSEELDLQLILVSHDKEFQIGEVINIEELMDE